MICQMLNTYLLNIKKEEKAFSSFIDENLTKPFDLHLNQ